MTMRTRIKICGFTTPGDVETACALGVDAVGFNLYPKSKRFISLGRLGELARHAGAFVTPVLLFVNPDRELVLEALRIVPNALLQFHGDETAEFCGGFSRPWIKAISMQNAGDLQKGLIEFKGAQALLCDTPTQSYGGSGRTFDWSLLSGGELHRLILAGGLSAENVYHAVKELNPYAVDVCSAVEEKPGVKSRERMEKFIEEVRRAQR